MSTESTEGRCRFKEQTTIKARRRTRVGEPCSVQKAKETAVGGENRLQQQSPDGVHVCSASRVQFFVIPWTVACQAPLSMGFSRQECSSGLPCPPTRDLPSSGIRPEPPAFPALAGEYFTAEPPGKPHEWNKHPYKGAPRGEDAGRRYGA